MISVLALLLKRNPFSIRAVNKERALLYTFIKNLLCGSSLKSFAGSSSLCEKYPGETFRLMLSCGGEREGRSLHVYQLLSSSRGVKT
jgi:hypothetical protein